MNNIPPYGAKGKYVLKAPYKLLSKTSYTCVSIESFEELERNNEQVYTKFYAPFNVSHVTYEHDARVGIVIVGLVSDDDRWIHVPSSFIISYPSDSDISYRRTILSVDLGLVHTNIDLTRIIQGIRTYASKVSGIPAAGGDLNIVVHQLPHLERIGKQEHRVLQQQRYHNIKNNPVPQLDVTVGRQTAQIEQLSARSTKLQEALIASVEREGDLTSRLKKANASLSANGLPTV